MDMERRDYSGKSPQGTEKKDVYSQGSWFPTLQVETIQRRERDESSISVQWKVDAWFMEISWE